MKRKSSEFERYHEVVHKKFTLNTFWELINNSKTDYLHHMPLISLTTFVQMAENPVFYLSFPLQMKVLSSVCVKA